MKASDLLRPFLGLLFNNLQTRGWRKWLQRPESTAIKQKKCQGQMWERSILPLPKFATLNIPVSAKK
ncbi:hypothetical protein BK127_39930 [Paenibacillus sp. FSL H7-0331]|nr:hypothetical protein BK127_39930 [Paenibacillus sp. FSL H7-0331]